MRDEKQKIRVRGIEPRAAAIRWEAAMLAVTPYPTEYDLLKLTY